MKNTFKINGFILIALLLIVLPIQSQRGPNLVRDGNFANFGRNVGAWGTGGWSQHGIWWNSYHANTTAGTITLRSNDRMYVEYGIRTALYISNRSPRSPHVYGTTAQKIRAYGNRTYRLSVWASARNLRTQNGVLFSVDRAWRNRPLGLPPGSYGWTYFTATFQTDETGMIDLRIISEDVGEVWLTGMTIYLEY